MNIIRTNTFRTLFKPTKTFFRVPAIGQIKLSPPSPSPFRSYATYRRFNSSNRSSPMDRKRLFYLTAIGGTVVGIGYYSNLEEAPVSHRKRFMIVPKDIETMIGEQNYQEVLSEFKGKLLPENDPTTLRVKRIMNRLIKVSGLQDLDWKIHVIYDPKSPPNAFVLPSGKVFVFNNILPICGNDDGLATVLSHETAHQVARHTAEHLSQAPFYLILGLVLYTMTGSQLLNNLLISSVFKLPSSREMETEADYIGLMMMSKACFNPTEAVHVWERMSNFETSNKAYGPNVPEFFSTHPASTRRITNIQGWIPEALQYREAAGCTNFGPFAHSVDGWSF